MTFSIIARDEETLGVGVVSGSVAARDRVPWVNGGVGAIATQGYTKPSYGREGLKLLEGGLSPKSVLKKLLREDRRPERRQVGILDANGRNVIHTGSSCPSKRSSEAQENCICLGNMLQSKLVVKKMAEAFEGEGRLSECILEALEAGAGAGGDRRGNQTVALLVKGEESIDIGIDRSEAPLQDLKEELK